MSDYYESEIEPIIGTEFTNNKKTIRKIKMKCNKCGCIDYRLSCPNCGYAMFKYKNIFK